MDIQQEADERGPITPVLRGRLEPADVDDELLAASVGPDSAAMALWASSTAAEARPVPAQADLPRLRPHVVERGATLHFFSGADWYSLSLDQYSDI